MTDQSTTPLDHVALLAAACRAREFVEVRETPGGVADRVILDDDDGVLLTHPRSVCVPRCVVHAPSTHALSDAPRQWRADRRLVERRCSHGVGHPDPDSIRFE